MKTFLALSIGAMVSAGIYGLADMAIDLRNGTMISYDRGDHAVAEEQPAPQQLAQVQHTVVFSPAKMKAAAKVNSNLVPARTLPPPPTIETFTTLYSRAAPETRTIEEVASAGVPLAPLAEVPLPEPAVLADPMPAPEVPVAVEPAEIELDESLFSRRPLRPKIVKPEALKPADDSLKNLSGREEL